MNNEITFEGNAQAQAAYNIITKTSYSVFIYGGAGTGKSEMIKKITDHFGDAVICCAPTGVAAKNIGGTTIHSMFGIPFKPIVFADQIKAGINPIRLSIDDKAYIYFHIKAVIIDEISMVSSYLLDNISASLQQIFKNDLPFGGLQIIGVGDPMQLPPILPKGDDLNEFRKRYNGEFFFDSVDFKKLNPVIINLEHVYRQNDNEFIELLNKIRFGSEIYKTISIINKKCYNGI